MYIVTYTLVIEENTTVDYYDVHGTRAHAQAQYDKLRDRDDLFTASINAVLESTDHDPANIEKVAWLRGYNEGMKDGRHKVCLQLRENLQISFNEGGKDA
jgi:hypothetical protein